MTRFCFSLTLLGLITLAPLAVHADPASDAQASIQAAYNRRNAALARFNIEGYFAVDSPSYHEMSQGHTKTLDGQRQAVIALLARAQKLSAQETVQSVSMIGKDAVVEIAGTGTLVTNPSAGRKSSIIKERYTGRAFWLSTPQGWRLKQERTLSTGFNLVNQPLPK